ncbi:hypothetical protein TSUD_164970 [Trifolium subterraneum]|uniref:Uncharacterized protein n=1 Tax=Trifolium subterraneum TaxID=3900 RepID=A0A2Z6MYY6_TRISU|nr:hypothetical protein TSUD_164970 [Trifolium subterraneum]
MIPINALFCEVPAPLPSHKRFRHRSLFRRRASDPPPLSSVRFSFHRFPTDSIVRRSHRYKDSWIQLFISKMLRFTELMLHRFTDGKRLKDTFGVFIEAKKLSRMSNSEALYAVSEQLENQEVEFKDPIVSGIEDKISAWTFLTKGTPFLLE